MLQCGKQETSNHAVMNVRHQVNACEVMEEITEKSRGAIHKAVFNSIFDVSEFLNVDRGLETALRTEKVLIGGLTHVQFYLDN